MLGVLALKKWNATVLPTPTSHYNVFHSLSLCLTFSLWLLLTFYCSNRRTIAISVVENAMYSHQCNNVN
ncbi:hypothetical protein XELAEV_18047003mg [Xenopus laevis]|uniref:Uncharacterized protein n=1 Tax=Xenopus laevis TaxID=8355 RepID=A0A974H155_XENLA|nr:hypothetical protein XELAEV_18047003mg [Xenopus laevis]